MGTHPKAFRNPRGPRTGERDAGAQPVGCLPLGARRDAPSRSGLTGEIAEADGFHRRSTTCRAITAGTRTPTSRPTACGCATPNRWVTITDKGRMTSLDNPEVRALASRYGNPDELLQEDWRPGMPGINQPGDYADYAQDPWKFVWGDIEKVMAGTYDYFYPTRPATTTTPPAPAPQPRARSESCHDDHLATPAYSWSPGVHHVRPGDVPRQRAAGHGQPHVALRAQGLRRRPAVAHPVGPRDLPASRDHRPRQVAGRGAHRSTA